MESRVSIYFVLHWVELGTFAWGLQEAHLDWKSFLQENELDLTFVCFEDNKSGPKCPNHWAV